MYNKFATTRIDVFYNTPVECSGQREYYYKGATTMTKLIDLTSKKFGRLTVMKYLGKSAWLCKCDCGNLKKIRGDHLRRGAIISCGCYTREIATELARQMGYKNRKYENLLHDKKQQRIYSIWKHMIKRCKDGNNKRYGKRGIKVCREWYNFENFYNWSINNGYQDNLTIDRIDNNNDYKPSNCRWITNKEQQRNRGDNVNITYNNETHCIAKWAEKLNLTRYETIKFFNKIKKEEANG